MAFKTVESILQPDPRFARRVAGALGYDSISDLHATVLDGRPRSPGALLVVLGSGEGHGRGCLEPGGGRALPSRGDDGRSGRAR